MFSPSSALSLWGLGAQRRVQCFISSLAFILTPVMDARQVPTPSP